MRQANQEHGQETIEIRLLLTPLVDSASPRNSAGQESLAPQDIANAGGRRVGLKKGEQQNAIHRAVFFNTMCWLVVMR